MINADARAPRNEKTNARAILSTKDRNAASFPKSPFTARFPPDRENESVISLTTMTKTVTANLRIDSNDPQQ